MERKEPWLYVRPERVEELRDAARQAVELESLRSVARAIGLSAPGLSDFLAGSRPRQRTLRRLVAWDLRRRRPSGEEPPPETIENAIALMTERLWRAERARTRRELLQVIAEAFRRVDVAAPTWLTTLQERTGEDARESPRRDEGGRES